MSLAVDFETIFDDGDPHKVAYWAWLNRDRILAALRGNGEDTRIARIVREPTEEQAHVIGWAALRDTPDETTVYRWHPEGYEACGAILMLAGETGPF